VTGGERSDIAGGLLERMRTAIRSPRRRWVGFAALLVCPIFANEGLLDVPRGGVMAARPRMCERPARLVTPTRVRTASAAPGAGGGLRRPPGSADMSGPAQAEAARAPAARRNGRQQRPWFAGSGRRTGLFQTFASSPLQASVGWRC